MSAPTDHLLIDTLVFYLGEIFGGVLLKINYGEAKRQSVTRVYHI